MAVMQCHFHPGEETRLTCKDCGKAICPKCMVSCEVGFKCPDCTSKMKSHVLQVEPKHFLVAGALAAAGGFGLGFLQPVLMGLGWIGWLASFFVGRGIGELIGKAIRYKKGREITLVVMMTCLLGLAVSPFLGTAMFAVLGPGSQMSLLVYNFLPVGIALWGLQTAFRV